MFPGKGPTGQAVRPRQGDIGSLRKTKTERGGGKTLPSYITLPPWQGKEKKNKKSSPPQCKEKPVHPPLLGLHKKKKRAEALQDWNSCNTETSSACSQLHNSCKSSDTPPPQACQTAATSECTRRETRSRVPPPPPPPLALSGLFETIILFLCSRLKKKTT